MTIAELDRLSAADAARTMLTCCGSRGWADAMAAARPFGTREALERAADAAFAALDERAWLEAFAAHPKIGDLDSLRKKFAHGGGQEAREQGAISAAGEETLRALQQLNEDYARAHGFIFIIFASGKSADEMLAALRRRLPRSRTEELAQAAREQRLITANRLTKLLAEPSAQEGSRS